MKALKLTIIFLILAPHPSWSSQYRDPAVRRAFTEQNPCPIYDEKAKKCLAEVDHKDALCAGGSDTIDNMQWLSKEQHRLKTLMDIKRCAIIRREWKEEK